MIDTANFSKILTARFGVDVDVKAFSERGGQRIVILPKCIVPALYFEIEMFLGWRHISASFSPGSYASELIRSIKAATVNQKAVFSTFAKSLKSKGADITVLLDSRNEDALFPDRWPEDWKTISIVMKKIGLVVESESGYQFDNVIPWACSFFGMAVSLIPLTELSSAPESEGTEYCRTVREYERSPINRAACVEIHGTACKICGFDFEKVYGSLGTGFIHVHHIVPVSAMGGPTVIDPARDLIPVCPNCHAMLHRCNPPLTPDELKQKLNQHCYGSSLSRETQLEYEQDKGL